MKAESDLQSVCCTPREWACDAHDGDRNPTLFDWSHLNSSPVFRQPFPMTAKPRSASPVMTMETANPMTRSTTNTIQRPFLCEATKAWEDMEFASESANRTNSANAPNNIARTAAPRLFDPHRRGISSPADTYIAVEKAQAIMWTTTIRTRSRSTCVAPVVLIRCTSRFLV